MISNLIEQLKLPSPIFKLESPLFKKHGVNVWVKREDLIHPWVSGNKWRKLKYNLIEAVSHGKETLITFGGAHSNHLYSVAGAGKLLGLKTVGLVRGESNVVNSTLDFCRTAGMELIDIPRSEYRLKEDSHFIKEIIHSYTNAYLIPEGGTNQLAIKGVSEMWDEIAEQCAEIPDIIVVACGTGGTAAGLCTKNVLNKSSKVLAISVLKSDHLYAEIETIIGDQDHIEFSVNNEYHFGGYAKMPVELLKAHEELTTEFKLPLDLVYNTKALFGLMDLIQKDYFDSGTNILYINTGGLRA